MQFITCYHFYHAAAVIERVQRVRSNAPLVRARAYADGRECVFLWRIPVSELELDCDQTSARCESYEGITEERKVERGSRMTYLNSTVETEGVRGGK